MPDRKVPRFEQVAKTWLALKKTNVRASTYAMYKRHIEERFEPAKPMQVNRIKTAVIEAWVARRRDAGCNLKHLTKNGSAPLAR